MIITISGNPGAGKSTVAKLLAKQLGMRRFSVGDLRGRMAIERGMTIDEFNAIGENQDFTDKLADEYQQRLGEEADNFIIDSRLGFHFIPKSYKVFLDVNPRKGAERIFSHAEDRPDERPQTSVEETEATNVQRIESNKRRYQKYYNVDMYDMSHYDLIIDTTDLTIEETAQKIAEKVKEKM